MKILAFGIAKEIVGGPLLDVDARGVTVDELKKQLAVLYPRLKQLTTFMIAVNGEYATADQVIKANDEIAIIPPVSGG